MPAGGIVPLAGEADLDATRNPDHLELVVVPGADGDFVLMEDDGTGTTPDTIPAARTPIAWDDAAGELTIGPAEDPHGVLAGARRWTVTLLGVPEDAVFAGTPEATWRPGRLSATFAEVAPGQELRVRATGTTGAPRTPDRDAALFEVLGHAQWRHEAKAAAWRTLSSDQAPAAQLAELLAVGTPPALLGALAELVTAR